MSRDAVVWMLAGALTVGVLRLTMVLLKAGWRLWLDQEAAKADAEQRKRFDVIHRSPAPMHERASQGFERRTKP